MLPSMIKWSMFLPQILRCPFSVTAKENTFNVRNISTNILVCFKKMTELQKNKIGNYFKIYT